MNLTDDDILYFLDSQEMIGDPSSLSFKEFKEALVKAFRLGDEHGWYLELDKHSKDINEHNSIKKK